MTKKREEKKYRIINLVMEYGQRLDGCKYAVATALSEEELKSTFKEELLPYEPYLYLTKEMGDAIVESQSNGSKHAKRQTKNEVSEDDVDGGFERLISTAYGIFGSMDPCELLITREEVEKANRKLNKDLKTLGLAMEELTDVQRRRIIAAYWEDKSTREISEQEGVRHSAVDKSIAASIRKLRKKF